jgi:hypothetical protein
MDMKKIIHNWDELTDEQKKDAENKFKGDPSLNPVVVHPAAKFFEEHRWVKIDKFIPIEMCNLLYHYTQLEALRLNWKEENDVETDIDIDGTFTDKQAPGDFSKYGDPLMDTVLSLSLEQMQTLTSKELIPTYSYHRLYTTGTDLKRHKDRPSCEISTTVCLGYDNTNVDASVYPDWDWPIFVKEKDGTEIPVHMKPGDMLIYRGCELEHWREPLWGRNHAQLFLHYNEKGGKYDIPYDGRPLLGMGSNFRTEDSKDKNDTLSHDADIIANQSENKVINTTQKIIY